MHLLYEYKDLFIDMDVRKNRSELAIANRHQERWNFTRWKIICIKVTDSSFFVLKHACIDQPSIFFQIYCDNIYIPALLQEWKLFYLALTALNIDRKPNLAQSLSRMDSSTTCLTTGMSKRISWVINLATPSINH